MTFLCTVDGELVAHVEQHEHGLGWPKPWALQCDRCESVFEYRADSQTGPDEHHCLICLPIVSRERAAERLARPVQLALVLTA